MAAAQQVAQQGHGPRRAGDEQFQRRCRVGQDAQGRELVEVPAAPGAAVAQVAQEGQRVGLGRIEAHDAGRVVVTQDAAQRRAQRLPPARGHGFVRLAARRGDEVQPQRAQAHDRVAVGQGQLGQDRGQVAGRGAGQYVAHLAGVGRPAGQPHVAAQAVDGQRRGRGHSVSNGAPARSQARVWVIKSVAMATVIWAAGMKMPWL